MDSIQRAALKLSEAVRIQDSYARKGEKEIRVLNAARQKEEDVAFDTYPFGQKRKKLYDVIWDKYQRKIDVIRERNRLLCDEADRALANYRRARTRRVTKGDTK